MMGTDEISRWWNELAVYRLIRHSEGEERYQQSQRAVYRSKSWSQVKRKGISQSFSNWSSISSQVPRKPFSKKKHKWLVNEFPMQLEMQSSARCSQPIFPVKKFKNAFVLEYGKESLLLGWLLCVILSSVMYMKYISATSIVSASTCICTY